MSTLKQKRENRFYSYAQPLIRVCQAINPKRVLEWGPGESTAIISRECPDAVILAIEHDPEYAESAQKRFSELPKVKILHKVISLAGGRSNGYVTTPLRMKIADKSPDYDLIFIDGRLRFDCVVTAYQLITESGIVMMHDSHRKNYRAATALFPHVRYFDDIRTVVMSKSPLPQFDEYKLTRIPNTVISVPDTLDSIQQRFESGKPFFYVRFGDADLLFIDDPKYVGNKRHSKSPELAAELAVAYMIDHPDFLIGSVGAGKVFKKVHNDRMKLIAGKLHEGREYHSAVALHSTYIEDSKRFIEFCRTCFHGKRVLLVGGESVCRNDLVKKVFDVTATIELPDINAYKALDSQMARITKNVAAVGKFDILISAAGQATRALAKRLWEKNLRQIQYFDVGSSIDALADRHLRSWIKRNLDQVEVYRKEFGS